MKVCILINKYIYFLIMASCCRMLTSRWLLLDGRLEFAIKLCNESWSCCSTEIGFTDGGAVSAVVEVELVDGMQSESDVCSDVLLSTPDFILPRFQSSSRVLHNLAVGTLWFIVKQTAYGLCVQQSVLISLFYDTLSYMAYFLKSGCFSLCCLSPARTKTHTAHTHTHIHT